MHVSQSTSAQLETCQPDSAAPLSVEKERELLDKAADLLHYSYTHNEGWGTKEGSLSLLRKHFMEQLQEGALELSEEDHCSSTPWLLQRQAKLLSMYTTELNNFAQLSQKHNQNLYLNQEAVISAHRLLMARERSQELTSLIEQTADKLNIKV
ncbi:MAG: hypothetical protein ACI376_09640 [Candidatus Bruticola sp.]